MPRHRRRQRQQDRALLAIASARERLSRHHGSGMAPPGTKQDGSRPPSGAAKKPYWGCSKCGFDTNWASRPKCHQCENDAPYKVLAKIVEAGANTKGSSQPVAKAKAKPQASNHGYFKGDAKSSESKLAAELAAAKKELEQLRNRNVQTTCNVAPSLEPSQSADSAILVEDAGDEATKGRVKSLREKLKLLRNMDPGLYQYLDSQGGHAKMVAEADAELQAACTSLREARPLSVRQASAEAHLRKVVKLHETAATQLSKLQKEQEDLTNRLAVQEAETAAAGLRVEAAKQEAAAITDRIAAGLRGSHSVPAGAPSVLPADVALVRDLLQLVPPNGLEKACATHGLASDEIVARAHTLIAKIEAQALVGSPTAELADRSTIYGHRPPGTASAVAAIVAEGQTFMDIDDELWDELAAAAVGNSGEGDEPERDLRIAATKARLKSSRGDLAKRMVVRRISKSKLPCSAVYDEHALCGSLASWS